MTHKTNEGNAKQIKRKAKKIKKEMGIPHHQALDISSMESGYSNFKNLLNNTQRPAKRKRIVSAAAILLPSPLTLPYNMFGSPKVTKRPNAKAPILLHQQLGTILKELHSAMEYNKKGRTAVSVLKCTLDDWIQLEYTSREELTDEVFFGIYYGDTNHPSDPWPTDKKKTELKNLVAAARALLNKAYHDCSPIQDMNKKLDVVINAINKWPLNKQVKGLKEVKGKIDGGTLIYLKKHHRKPAIVLSHDTLNNLIRCYEDAGPTTMEREEITVARNQTEAKKFNPMRLWLPYGKWFCEDGIEVLFNRDYIPIWMKDKNGKVHQIDPNTQVEYNGDPEFYFSDGSTPWGGDKSTLVKCRNILNNWHIAHRASLLIEALNESIANGNANNLKFRNRTNTFP